MVVVDVDVAVVVVGVDEEVGTAVARMPCLLGEGTVVVAVVDTEETATAVVVVDAGKRFAEQVAVSHTRQSVSQRSQSDWARLD